MVPLELGGDVMSDVFERLLGGALRIDRSIDPDFDDPDGGFAALGGRPFPYLPTIRTP